MRIRIRKNIKILQCINFDRGRKNFKSTRSWWYHVRNQPYSYFHYRITGRHLPFSRRGPAWQVETDPGAIPWQKLHGRRWIYTAANRYGRPIKSTLSLSRNGREAGRGERFQAVYARVRSAASSNWLVEERRRIKSIGPPCTSAHASIRPPSALSPAASVVRPAPRTISTDN